MPIWCNQGGTWIAAAPSVFNDGAFVPVKAAFVKFGNVWRPLFSVLEISTAPLALFGYGTAGNGVVATSLTTSTTIEQGVGPFAYNWRRISGSSLITPQNGNSANTGFSANLTGNQSVSAAFVCDVTDAAGKTETSEPVSVDLVNYDAPVIPDEFDPTDILGRLDDLENPP